MMNARHLTTFSPRDARDARDLRNLAELNAPSVDDETLREWSRSSVVGDIAKAELAIRATASTPDPGDHFIHPGELEYAELPEAWDPHACPMLSGAGACQLEADHNGPHVWPGQLGQRCRAPECQRPASFHPRSPYCQAHIRELAWQAFGDQA